MEGRLVNQTIIGVFKGGVSSEREVSLGSGKAAAEALAVNFPVEVFEVNAEAIPAGVDPKRHVIFSTLHGGFGENGGMQRALEQAGIAYAGCDSTASSLCIDKVATRDRVSAAAVRVAPGLAFAADQVPSVEQVISALGERVVLKPASEGSSVGLAFADGSEAIAKALAALAPGRWLAERRIVGRECTVGLLDGKAMGVVEIRPRTGRFDYESKYTKGLTEYLAPAPLDESLAAEAQRMSEVAFAACGCRDYARIDLMLSAEGEFYFLEVNTLPGLKETSLLPMSAACIGLSFPQLLQALVAPAVERFRRTHAA
jgi:D-alanine-D-alanine ligase